MQDEKPEGQHAGPSDEPERPRDVAEITMAWVDNHGDCLKCRDYSIARCPTCHRCRRCVTGLGHSDTCAIAAVVE